MRYLATAWVNTRLLLRGKVDGILRRLILAVVIYLIALTAPMACAHPGGANSAEVITTIPLKRD